jgi:DNA-directed RNA polymerase subunit RPC12/RpoP
MIDSVLNLLFRCSHRRLTRPVTPVSKAGVPQGQTYVVCLDCGKQFAYDFLKMRIGRPLENSLEHGVLPPDMPQPRARKVKFALWASLPLAIFLGSVLKSKKPRNGPPQDTKPKRGGS